MRIILAVAAVFISLLALRGADTHVPPALACSIAPSTLEDHVKQAVFIGVVEPIIVGDGVNRVPTMTPRPTETPFETETPPSATATRRGFISLETATPQPESTATPSFEPDDARLVGRSASLMVVEESHGTGASELRIDYAAREGYERRIRLEAAGSRNSCGLGFLPEYQLGVRYLVVAVSYSSGDLYTFANYRIAGAGSAAQADVGTLTLREATYRRFLADFPADVRDFSVGERAAYVEIGGLPLDRMQRLLLAMRGDVTIAPPETGSAGLFAARAAP